jgi:glycosyltransferase involved in cell wall biosynthesis
LVPPRDPRLLAEALRGLLTDALRREELSRRGRERVERDFDRERGVDSVEALFRQIDKPAGNSI